ncbi:hypothetical protein H2201_000355 [Coniosporium apollinis]|uniref:Autophagy-related protein 16 domain-containing protein n=1 Tax=Coniosporium apollinis TaxID=61459 RepID=A0ABQ9P9D4_9PEZI|nr:hypothetical protein H2201_000355 [Coniosporium apollinis]
MPSARSGNRAARASRTAEREDLDGDEGAARQSQPTRQAGWFGEFKKEYKQQKYQRGLPSNKLRRTVQELQDMNDDLSLTNSRLHTRANEQEEELERLRTENAQLRTGLTQITQTEEEFQWWLRGFISYLTIEMSYNQADCDLVEYLTEVHNYQHARAEEVVGYLVRAAPDLEQGLQEKRAELERESINQWERNFTRDRRRWVPILEAHRSPTHSSSRSPEPGPPRKKSRTDSGTERSTSSAIGSDTDYDDLKTESNYDDLKSDGEDANSDVEDSRSDRDTERPRSSAIASEERGRRSKTV